MTLGSRHHVGRFLRGHVILVALLTQVLTCGDGMCATLWRSRSAICCLNTPLQLLCVWICIFSLISSDVRKLTMSISDYMQYTDQVTVIPAVECSGMSLDNGYLNSIRIVSMRRRYSQGMRGRTGLWVFYSLNYM